MIIFINGASSAGKTSVARELQKQWSGPLLYWSLDDVISQLPFSYTGVGSNAVDGFPIQTYPGGGLEIGCGKHGRVLNELSASYLSAQAGRGFDVVADFVLLDESMYQTYQSALFDVPVVFVGLYCDAEMLARRNDQRQDRVAGLAVHQQEQIHFCEENYDLKLDSTNIEPDALVISILTCIQSRPPTVGF